LACPRPLISRPDPQIDASDANFPSSRVVRVALSWRRSLQRPTLCVPAPIVGAAAGRLGYRPADDRPSLIARTDQQGASLEVSQFRSAFASCAVLFEGDQPSNHPAAAFCRLGVTQRPSAGSPLRFLAPRVSGAVGFAILETPPARVIRGRLLFGSRTGPADRAVIAAWPGLLVPATLLGFSSALRSIALRPRVTASFDASRPPAVSPSARREFHRRGVRPIWGEPKGLWPRLLGFGPADEPCRAICRPRYSFCAQGRSDSPAETAMSFASSLRFSSPDPGLHFWSLSAHGLFARASSTRLQLTGHAAMPRGPFGVLRDRRLADPAVFPSAPASCLRFSRRPPNRSPTHIGAVP